MAKTIFTDNPLLSDKSEELEKPDLKTDWPAKTESGDQDTVSVFTDLGSILDGDHEPELPTLGAVNGGKCLFYSGRLNEIHGEPSVGKTNINLSFCAKELNRGATIIFLDPEDTPRGIALRLLSFGADREAIRERFKYLHNPEPMDILTAVKWAKDNTVEIVIADGLAELLAAQGLSEDKPLDILPFYRKFLRPFADAGAAVVISDHVIKDSESRGLWPRGSGGKMGRYDGAVYLIKLIESYGPDKAGSVRLTVAKDRNGGVGPKGTAVAEIHFTPGEGEATHVEFKQPEGRAFEPTVLMSKVCQAINADPDISKRGLRSLGKSQSVEQAIRILEGDGIIRVEKQGPGKPDRFILIESDKP